jgi:hypothetical protein
MSIPHYPELVYNAEGIEREGGRTASISNQILKTDIKSRIRRRRESLSRLADNILGTAVIIAHGIFDLPTTTTNSLAHH